MRRRTPRSAHVSTDRFFCEKCLLCLAIDCFDESLIEWKTVVRLLPPILACLIYAHPPARRHATNWICPAISARAADTLLSTNDSSLIGICRACVHNINWVNQVFAIDFIQLGTPALTIIIKDRNMIALIEREATTWWGWRSWLTEYIMSKMTCRKTCLRQPPLEKWQRAFTAGDKFEMAVCCSAKCQVKRYNNGPFLLKTIRSTGCSQDGYLCRHCCCCCCCCSSFHNLNHWSIL